MSDSLDSMISVAVEKLAEKQAALRKASIRIFELEDCLDAARRDVRWRDAAVWQSQLDIEQARWALRSAAVLDAQRDLYRAIALEAKHPSTRSSALDAIARLDRQ